ncbi:MAG TPA: hypothetical protein VKX17_04860 [Planctomycetota bacterium]|nr:hypothetical protein [Planctomycetota bacterium]
MHRICAISLVAAAIVTLRASDFSIADEEKYENGSKTIAIVFGAQKQAVTATGDDLKLWDAAGGKLKERAKSHTIGMGMGFLSLAISPDGKWIASGTGDQGVRLYAVNGAALNEKPPLKDHIKAIHATAFSADSKLLATGSDDMSFHVYDITGEKPKDRITHKIEKANLGIKALFFLDGGKKLLTGCGNGDIRVFELKDDSAAELGKTKIKTSGFMFPSALSPDEKILAVGSENGVHAFKINNGAFNDLFAMKDQHTKQVTSVAYSPDGNFVASTSKDGKIVLYDAASGTVLMNKQHSGEFKTIAFLPDSTKTSIRLAAGGSFNNTQVSVFTVKAGQ